MIIRFMSCEEAVNSHNRKNMVTVQNPLIRTVYTI